jgi:hypothetical protein
MPPFARYIIEMNIRHYRKKLETETDPRTRQTIESLLWREERELRELARPAVRPQGSSDPG